MSNLRRHWSKGDRKLLADQIRAERKVYKNVLGNRKGRKSHFDVHKKRETFLKKNPHVMM